MNSQFKSLESSVPTFFLTAAKSNVASQDWLVLKPAVGGLTGIALGILIGNLLGWC